MFTNNWQQYVTLLPCTITLDGLAWHGWDGFYIIPFFILSCLSLARNVPTNAVLYCNYHATKRKAGGIYSICKGPLCTCIFSVVACLLADTCKGKGGENEISAHMESACADLGEI